jgi:hypothetical protein
MKRPFELYILCLLLLFISVGALYGGGALVLKPDGSLLGMQPWLNEMPFPSFLIPGIVLFLLNGVFPLFTVVGLFFKPDWAFFDIVNIYKDKHWSWAYSLYSGIVIIAWIIVQQFLTAYFILQPIVAFSGLLIMIFTLMPRVVSYSKR